MQAHHDKTAESQMARQGRESRYIPKDQKPGNGSVNRKKEDGLPG